MKDLDMFRQIIDNIDKHIVILFNMRMETIKELSIYKQNNNIPINDNQREIELIEKNKNLINKDFYKYYEQLYKEILKISKDYQKNIINHKEKIWYLIKK